MIARNNEAGFSLVELMIAVALMLLVMAMVGAALTPVYATFRTNPEVADVQQRLRVAATTLSHELTEAGNGAWRARPGPLMNALPAVAPFRRGLRGADPPGTFRRDVISVLRVPPGGAQSTLVEPLPAQSRSVHIDTGAGCPLADLSCGFALHDDVIVYDDTGSYDTFEIMAINGSLLTLQHTMPDSTVSYSPGASILSIVSRTFYLKTDRATGASQLMQYDGGMGAGVPVVDHIVDLSFEYEGDPQPPTARAPSSSPFDRPVTYGPAPPAPGVQTTAYPPGENCVLASDGHGGATPRLDVLGAGAGPLVPLGTAVLTDGPWCPDATSANRYDADLFRIRRLTMVVRVEAADATLRGPAGPLFQRPGLSTNATRQVPDQAFRLQLSPRNLNVEK